jgi:hypothetical protein
MKAPSRLWYLTLAVGLGISVATNFGGGACLQREVEAMPRAVVPDAAVVTLVPGTYTLYSEWGATIDGVTYTQPTGTILCGLSAPDGSDAHLRPTSSRTFYSAGPYKGTSLFQVDVVTAGEHRLECENPSNERVVVAFGRGFGRTVWLMVAGVYLPALAGIIASLVVFIRRRRAARSATVPVV